MDRTALKNAVSASLEAAPVIGVVRTRLPEEAVRVARLFIEGGLQLIEITFSVPDATRLVEQLRKEVGDGPPWIGMGTVTDGERARRALDAGAQFIVSPNVSAEVAEEAVAASTYLVIGALTCTEIVNASRLGADLVKVYPLPPVGGPAYLNVVRQPLDDIPMLAAGGFGIEEIPAYKKVGAIAFGIGAPLLGDSDEQSLRTIGRALTLAGGTS